MVAADPEGMAKTRAVFEVTDEDSRVVVQWPVTVPVADFLFSAFDHLFSWVHQLPVIHRVKGQCF